MPGILYVVATPIGNLEDITVRALRILREAGRIACEDTRHTRKLLDHFGIAKPMLSYHEHNEAARASELVAMLESGENIALVSDAGTPLISDPGYRLVAAAIDAGISVVPIPGASAAIAALSASGLPTDAFRFGGFLPAKRSARRKLLEQLKPESSTLIFYEAPHRILETLDDIADVMGARKIVIARELTKMHEEILRGTAAELRDQLQGRPSIRGEITLLIGKPEAAAIDETPVAEAVGELERRGVARMDAIKQVAKARGLSKREVYRIVTGTGHE
jgi:16S rRNA (cytidine1402-2'-O)-methyltransferase